MAPKSNIEQSHLRSSKNPAFPDDAKTIAGGRNLFGPMKGGGATPHT